MYPFVAAPSVGSPSDFQEGIKHVEIFEEIVFIFCIPLSLSIATFSRFLFEFSSVGDLFTALGTSLPPDRNKIRIREKKKERFPALPSIPWTVSVLQRHHFSVRRKTFQGRILRRCVEVLHALIVAGFLHPSLHTRWHQLRNLDAGLPEQRADLHR